MPTCVPTKDLRDTVAFARLVAESPEPVCVTRNGYSAFVAMRNADYDELRRADARADLYRRMLIAERERKAGVTSSLHDDIAQLRSEYGL